MRKDNWNPIAFLVWLMLALGLSGAPARAQNFWEDTVLAGIYRSGNSRSVQSISWGATRLSNGSQVPLRQWYSAGMQDWHVTMLTAVNKNFGLLWGFGIGEAGEKYRIDPSLTLGFIYTYEPGPSSTLSFRLSTVLGGRLTERPCVANYGAIGGVQTVNCRLAASPMRPADTLRHLIDNEPYEQIRLNVVYKFRF